MPGCKKCGTLASTAHGLCLFCCEKEITRLRLLEEGIAKPLEALLIKR